MELSQLTSQLLSLISHPLWFIVAALLYLVLRLQRKGSWKPRQCPVDLRGKTAIVTGANTGIGKYIAQDLAQRNARVILACRSAERGEKAEREIRHWTGNSNVHFRILDTSSLESVRKFTEQIRKEEKQLDILLNNAGASGLDWAITSEGLELTIATNHLGPFLLTNLLLDLLKRSTNARIVNVSSMNHRRGKVDFKHFKGENPPTSGKDAMYNNTKLMNVLFTEELSQRLKHTGVTVNAVHPGVVMSEIMRNYNVLLRIIFNLIGIFFFKFSEEGAVSPIYCAVSKEMDGVSGKYIDSDCSLTLPSPLAQDQALAKKLWEVSESFTGLTNDKSQVNAM
ncbi:retinol dehydrogenase 11 isoform X1 [Rhincodon typus]|uniref:retinol dehydrogenase 11 isoform X1 n=1 Tax=Rhincodon typus TaxID=259920 RepID=UPI00202DBB74|nr:retinol dehydrogenase 11 isoform X1 [Rhincodon typus]